MARIFIDGFENGSLDHWVLGGSNLWYIAASSASSAFKGSYCINLSQYSTATKTLGSSLTSLYMAFKFYKTSTQSGDFLFFKDSAGTICASLGFNATSSRLELKRGGSAGNSGANGTLLATGSFDWTSNSLTKLIEIYYKPDSSSGVFTIKLDGAQDVTYSGNTTAGLGNFQTLYFSTNSVGAGGAMGYIDDVVIDDANWIGNTYIQAIKPTGAGTTTNWTPSTGSNYSCVDEVPASDTDYLTTNSTGNIDTYATGDLTGTISTIKSVQLEARITYEGSPVPTKIELGCRSNGADYFSTDFAPGLAFGRVSKLILVDPDGDSEWTEARVNQLEIGIKAAA